MVSLTGSRHITDGKAIVAASRGPPCSIARVVVVEFAGLKFDDKKFNIRQQTWAVAGDTNRPDPAATRREQGKERRKFDK